MDAVTGCWHTPMKTQGVTIVNGNGRPASVHRTSHVATFACEASVRRLRTVVWAPTGSGSARSAPANSLTRGSLVAASRRQFASTAAGGRLAIREPASRR